MNKRTVPNYLDIFEKRISRCKDRIKQELSKDRSHRDRRVLKLMLSEVKHLKHALRDARDEHQPKCPHCNHKL